MFHKTCPNARTKSYLGNIHNITRQLLRQQRPTDIYDMGQAEKTTSYECVVEQILIFYCVDTLLY